MDKIRKYSVLRYMPGEVGRRNECKLMLGTGGFEEALRRTAGHTHIDLGANVGVYTRRMAAGAGTVVAFEPDPWAFGVLRENLADLRNVVLVNSAAGTSGRPALLHRSPQFEAAPALYSRSSSLIANKINVVGGRSFRVPQVDFVTYLEGLDEDIGVVKMDIEGGEVAVLESLLATPEILRRIRYIFAETHERKIPEHRFRVKRIRRAARRVKRPYINLYWH